MTVGGDHDPTGEQGFSLIELVVVMALAMVVLLATLAAFDNFSAASNDNQQLTAVQDAARIDVDQMTRVIRNAVATSAAGSPVIRATASDLIISTYNQGSTAGEIRYCVQTNADGRTGSLWQETLPSLAAGANLPDTACPSTNAGWQRGRIVANLTNLAPFTYDNASAASVHAVSLNLGVSSGGHRSTVLSGAIALRAGSGRAPLATANNVTVQCSADNKSALIGIDSAAASSGSVAASFFTTANTLLGKSAITLQSSSAANLSQDINVTITDALGLNQTILKHVSCPPTS